MGVWASLALMCTSALCGSITDLAFDLEGYSWQPMNCLFIASYSLYLRGIMDKVVALTANKTRLDEFSMVRLHASRCNVILPLFGLKYSFKSDLMGMTSVGSASHDRMMRKWPVASTSIWAKNPVCS